jgi:hypothetical protein
MPTITNTPTVRERVERGAAWLDEVKPEWRTLIDAEGLQMYSPQFCVLGQVFSVEAYEQKTGTGYAHAFTLSGAGAATWAINHGFESGGEDYSTLRAAWLGFLAEEG